MPFADSCQIKLDDCKAIKCIQYLSDCACKPAGHPIKVMLRKNKAPFITL